MQLSQINILGERLLNSSLSLSLSLIEKYCLIYALVTQILYTYQIIFSSDRKLIVKY